MCMSATTLHALRCCPSFHPMWRYVSEIKVCTSTQFQRHTQTHATGKHKPLSILEHWSEGKLNKGTGMIQSRKKKHVSARQRVCACVCLGVVTQVLSELSPGINLFWLWIDSRMVDHWSNNPGSTLDIGLKEILYFTSPLGNCCIMGRALWCTVTDNWDINKRKNLLNNIKHKWTWRSWSFKDTDFMSRCYELALIHMNLSYLKLDESQFWFIH